MLCKITAFQGCPRDFYSKLRVVCCMLLPHNPYSVPSITRCNSVRQHVPVNIDFLQTSPVFIYWFCLNNKYYIMPLKTFQVNNSFSFHGPMVIFNPHLTSVQAKKQKHTMSETALVSWDKCGVAMCCHINQDCLDGLWAVEGKPFWLQKKSPDLLSI